MKLKKWKNTSWGQVWRSVLRGLPEWTLRYGRKPKARRYIAEGGPFNGKTLLLVDGDTATIRVGDKRGRYLCGLVADRHDFAPGTTIWRPVQ